jgi:acetyl esterase/lipase
MPDVTDVPDAVVVERGIVFAEKDGYRFLELDVHRPADASRPLPVLHQIHGGGWRVSHRGRAPRETRAWSPTFFERMVAAGFVVVASSYRYSGEAHYPAAVEDSLDAVRWVRAHIADHGGDPSRQVVFGQSAGGYLAAAVGLSREIEPVDGVVCWYPLTDPGAIADDDPAADFPRDWLGATLSTIPAVTAVPDPARHARHDGTRRPGPSAPHRARRGRRGVDVRAGRGGGALLRRVRRRRRERAVRPRDGVRPCLRRRLTIGMTTGSPPAYTLIPRSVRAV